MGTLIAVAIERAHAIEMVGKTEAAREGERLKSALLDAITHDFRTPLTSMKASVTTLLSPAKLDGEQRDELLHIIDEECDRLNRLVGEAAEMARLEAGEVKLQLEPVRVGDLISGALDVCKGVLGTRPIRIELKNPDLRVRADFARAEEVLVHLIQNANLYSSAGPRHYDQRGREGRVCAVQRRRPGAGDRRGGTRPHFRQILSRLGPALSSAGHGHGPAHRESDRRGAWGNNQCDQPGGTRVCIFFYIADPQGGNGTKMSTPTISGC